MDWKMPGVDGLEAARQIQGQAGLAKLPTVMMVSAYGRQEAMMEAEAAGILAFLVKPVDVGVLLDTIVNLLGGDDWASASTVTAAAPSAPDALPRVAPGLCGARVLLVEDNEINREVAVEILTDAGLVVEIAENGRIACDRVLTGDGGDSTRCSRTCRCRRWMASRPRAAFAKASRPIACPSLP